VFLPLLVGHVFSFIVFASLVAHVLRTYFSSSSFSPLLFCENPSGFANDAEHCLSFKCFFSAIRGSSVY